MLATLGQNAIQYVSKATTALVLYFGAIAVIDGQLSVGALIAFNMIMGQATTPILRLSQLWQDFQQVQISGRAAWRYLQRAAGEQADGLCDVAARARRHSD